MLGEGGGVPGRTAVRERRRAGRGERQERADQCDAHQPDTCVVPPHPTRVLGRFRPNLQSDAKNDDHDRLCGRWFARHVHHRSGAGRHRLAPVTSRNPSTTIGHGTICLGRPDGADAIAQDALVLLGICGRDVGGIEAGRQRELLSGGERCGVGGRTSMAPGDQHASDVRHPDAEDQGDHDDRGHDDRDRASLVASCELLRSVASPRDGSTTRTATRSGARERPRRS